MKCILILGATSDIAISLAMKFAEQNYSLILAGRSIQDLDSLKSDISIRYEVPVWIHEFNACSFSDHNNFFSKLECVPDTTICVFGYLGDQIQAQSNWNESKKILDTNLIGAISILNIVSEKYEHQGKGSIVGISSVAGERGRQSNYIYGASKAGFTAYLSGLRNRLFKSNIHVLTVKPGFVATKMTEGLNLPKALTANPDQVALSILKGLKKKKNNIYILPVWRLIMFIIRTIPEMIFKRMDL